MSYSISVNPEEVLTILNDLGYRNITGKQLKEFIKDLKKLIKYEQKIGALPSVQLEMETEKRKTECFQHLHSAITMNYEAEATNLKIPVNNNQKKIIELPPKIQSIPVMEISARKSVSTQTNEKLPFLRDYREPMTVIQLPNITPPDRDMPLLNNTVKTKNSIVENPISADENKRLPSGRDPNIKHQNKMWIRNRPMNSVNHISINKKDPVALYQFYKSCWDKYKQHLPGENDHTELRWKIRQKLLSNDK